MEHTPTPEIYTLSLHDALPILDTPIIFIEARINLSRFVVTGCAAKTAQIYRSEERFSRNAETDLVCRLLLEKKRGRGTLVHHPARGHALPHAMELPLPDSATRL